MNVAILSDIHMRDGHVDSVSAELEAVTTVLKREHDPTHAFVLGDLIEDCGSPEADRNNVDRVASILDDWSVPVTYLLGNHDVEYLDRTQLRDLLDQDEFYGVETVGEVSFLYLDSSYQEVRGATGRVGPEQLDWLTDHLPSLSNVVVLVHHPVGNFDLSANEWFAEYPERAYLWDRKEVLTRLDRVDSVRATVSGHIHQTDYDRFWELPHVSVNAFSKELPDVPLTGTYAVLDLEEPLGIDVMTRSDAGVSYTIG